MTNEFIAAVKQGELENVERMLAKDPGLAGAKDESGVSAILLSYYHGRPELAGVLMAIRPALDIFEAAAAGDAGRAGELLAKDHGLANAWSADGFFPLGLAAFFKRPAVARVLLQHGADPRMASRPAGFTPLHSAVADDAGSAAPELVRMLLDAGADPNAQSGTGGTPLHTAAFTGNIAVTEMLLAAGADLSARDTTGSTPLDRAREQGHSQVATRLRDAARGTGG